MQFEDCEIGMKVRAVRKSICPVTWGEFLSHHPDGTAQITNKLSSLDGLGGASAIALGSYNFAPSDLEAVKEDLWVCDKREDCPNKVCSGHVPRTMKQLQDSGSVLAFNSQVKTCHQRNTVKAILYKEDKVMREKQYESLKPITLAALRESGSCESELYAFAVEVCRKSFSYHYAPIPPEVAIAVCESLGINWSGLVRKGFIAEKKVEAPKFDRSRISLEGGSLCYEFALGLRYTVATLSERGLSLIGGMGQDKVPFPLDEEGRIKVVNS